MFITPWLAAGGGLLLAALLALASGGLIEPYWAGYHLLLSLLTALCYGFDKWAAQRDWRRVPERRLLLLDLLGGWPGGAAAQWLFHHKTRKHSYQQRFLMAAVLHLGALVVCWHWGPQPLMELLRATVSK